jgi:hypothetical protein
MPTIGELRADFETMDNQGKRELIAILKKQGKHNPKIKNFYEECLAKYNESNDEVTIEPRTVPWKWIGIGAGALVAIIVVFMFIVFGSGNDRELIGGWADSARNVGDTGAALGQMYVFESNGECEHVTYVTLLGVKRIEQKRGTFETKNGIITISWTINHLVLENNAGVVTTNEKTNIRTTEQLEYSIDGDIMTMTRENGATFQLYRRRE